LNTEGESITESLVSVNLRPLQIGDGELLLALYSANRAFLEPFDPPRAPDFLTSSGQTREVAFSVEAAAVGAAQRFVISDGDDPVGVLGISNIIEGAFRSANLGYWVAQEHNGRGVATAAVAQAVEWAFDERGLHRLEAGTLLDNVGSQKVLERNGFLRIGISRRYLHIGGAWRDHVLFARTND
jgi:[ribosomal protein S5]-alanine N-acetyltransferase